MTHNQERSGLIDQRDRAEDKAVQLERLVQKLERKVDHLENLLIMQGAVLVG